MNPPKPVIDLDALTRTSDGPNAIPAPKGRWRFALVPLVLILGLAFVFFDTLRDLLEVSYAVSVIRPKASSDVVASAGSVVFQAAGWVEPDPSRIRVTALTSGVVESLLVEESDAVKAGEPIARLVADDAHLEVNAAMATLERRRAEVRVAEVESGSAQEAFEAALEVTEARDTSRGDYEAKLAEVARRRAAVTTAVAAVSVARSDLATQKYLEDANAVGPWQVELASARLLTAEANLKALEAAVPEALAEVIRAKARRDRAALDYELRIAERRRVDLAKAQVTLALANVAEAEAAHEAAKLRLERMVVVSPVDGIVLSREANAGSPVGPLHDNLPVVQLYDPTELRVRIDVPQSQVGGASIGQRAEIRCDVRRDRPYKGRVLRIVETADIQKVTLEVQVRVEDPDHLLKPDMLCQVSVLSDGVPSSAADQKETAVTIPSRCVIGSDGVFVVDGETGKAARRTVTLGARSGDQVVVLTGLNVTDKVIDRGAGQLKEGARIRVENDR